MAEPASPDACRPGASRPGSSSIPTTAARPRLPGPLVLWAGLGGAVGVLLNAGTHALLDGPAASLFGPAAGSTPVMALANLLGAFLLGLLNGRARTSPVPWDPRVTAALGTGVLGAYTSFSAVAELLGSPFATALTAGPRAFGAGEVLGSAARGLLLAVLTAAAGTLCAWAGLRAGTRRPPDEDRRSADGPGGLQAGPAAGAAR
ncbi:hypothetical protein ACL90Y_01945 [Micrococcus luteus]